MELAKVTEYFEKNWAKIFEDWKEFVQIPSISSDPAFSSECSRCAEWVSNFLNNIGLKSELIQTSSKPIVFASHPGFTKQDRPTVLYYGHYDVQPPEPLDEWTSEPFELQIRGERAYGRGSQDNKGQLVFVFWALKFLIETESLSCPIKLCIEGEEESMSLALGDMLSELKQKFSANVLMSCDTQAYQAGEPAMTVGLRGWAAMTLKLKGPNADLHSGMHGGVSPNPALGLSQLLSSVFDENGKILVPGFYDEVSTPSSTELELMKACDLDPEGYKQSFGVYPVGGESGFGSAERAGRRPTFEVNGMYSGHTGEGIKTIIPSFAVAKITMRLVHDQDPQKVLDSVIRYLKEKTPEHFSLEVIDPIAESKALMVDPQSQAVLHSRQVLEELCGKPPVICWSGGSIPILARMVEALECEPVLAAFGLPEDRIHGPNESFLLSQFQLGFQYTVQYLSTFGV